jgi:N utilization substance protein B
MQSTRGSDHSGRHRARELVLRGLYERQMSARADDDIAISLLGGSDEPRADDAGDSAGEPDVDRTYLGELWRGATREYDALLQALAGDVTRDVAGLSPIERALLVIGAWELTHRLDVPYRVVIDEAVGLAKAYGGTDGYKFVNGVLDKLAARVRADEIRARDGR